MSRIWIEDMEIGQDISGTYAIASAQLRPYSGGEFLSLRLADRTGKISAVFWEGSSQLLRRIADGGPVRVKGKVGRYQGKPQVTLSILEPLPPGETFDESDFLPAGPLDTATLLERLNAWKDSLASPLYRQLWEQFFEDRETFQKFLSAPAGKQWHHAYLGGLLEHTVSLIDLCDRIAQQYDYLNRDLLLTGALLHDVGKARELTYRITFDYSDEGRLIGHIMMGAQKARDYLSRVPDFPREEAILLEHLILSHQGDTPESPRLPRCREALVLNLADLIDSQLSAYTREMDKPDAASQPWTPYVNLLARHLYRGPMKESAEEADTAAPPLLEND